VRWYREGVNRFLVWLAASGLSNGNWLRAEVIESYLAADRSTNAPATVAGHYRSLVGWFSWLVERQYIDVSPMKPIPAPHVPASEPKRTSLDEYVILLDSIPSGDWINLRDRLIIQTFFLCGIRLGECAHLIAADYRLPQHLLRVDGKTGLRLVPLLPAVERAFVAYLFLRPESSVSSLFLSSTGGRNVRHEPLHEKGIYQMLRRHCQRAGLRNLNPHSFRHGLAMHLLNEGGDMSLVQKVLGHSQISTTAKHYANWLTDGLQREFVEKMRGLGR
jgi:integrase/recombinase XerC